MKTTLSILLIGAALAFGCSHKVNVEKTEPTAPVSNKITGSVLVYLPPEIASYSYEVPVTSTVCAGETFTVNLGETFTNTLRKALSSSCMNVTYTDVKPKAEWMQEQRVSFLIVPKVHNVSGEINFAKGMGSTETKSTFFTSMTFDVLDRSEKSFYGFTVNASGSVMGKGTCSEGADLIGKAVAQTMQEIQDSVVTRLTTSDKLKEMSSLEIVK